MIVLTDKPTGYHCLECGELIEGDHITRPYPWITMAFCPACARDLGRKLSEEAAELFTRVLAPLPE